MVTVYILHSEKLDSYYIGSCSDFPMRMQEHLIKKYKNSYTSKAEDWALKIKVDDLGYKQARSIESHIKRMKSKTYIENLIEWPEIVERLKLKYS